MAGGAGGSADAGLVLYLYRIMVHTRAAINVLRLRGLLCTCGDPGGFIRLISGSYSALVTRLGHT